MKIFNKNNEDYNWETKVNFVDGNNVLIGYDTMQCCCEHADWFFSKKKIDKYDYNINYDGLKEQLDLEYYNFDVDFFEEYEDTNLDAGTRVVFRLTAEGKDDLYLHIFNAHNGYYGHGFEATINGIDWHSGTL
jgi:hypothetical protein